ncbi:MAG: ATP-binding protein [Clostridia bacterium]|nr:ATP-binding protein [Clostridia bacterium]MBQ9880069.1 ATP-binding protein [Clostridia bacterium]
MEYIERELERKFKEADAFFKAVLVTGARQVGKSTMLKHLAEKQNRTVVTMDNDLARELAKSDPVLFFQTYKPPILIDEIQKAPELLEQIKIMCDDSEERGRFWLTGSQRKKLMERSRDTLAGRLGILKLYGLSQREKNKALHPDELDFSMGALSGRAGMMPENDIDAVFEHIRRGGYPDVMNANDEQMRLYYQSYIENYLIADAVNDEGISDVVSFRRFLRVCAALIGNLVNYKTLADTAGISVPTARKWLDILQDMDVVYLLEPYSNNELQRLAKTPKLYFCDTGLCAFLTRWLTVGSLRDGAANGHFFENYVVMELVKNYAYSPKTAMLSFYRDSNANEIDVFVEEDGKIHPLEIKMSANPDKKQIKKYAVLEKTTIEKSHGGIICMVPRPFPIDRENSLIPCNLI